jgi:DNA-binding transcriptional regulator YiaG
MNTPVGDRRGRPEFFDELKNRKNAHMKPEEETTQASTVAVGSSSNVACEEADEVLRKLDEKLAPRIKAYRESERLSEEDFAIRINARK